MKVYPKQGKTGPKAGDFYFGDYGDIPVGVSSSTLEAPGPTRDTEHYHKKGHEFYVTIAGAGVLCVDGQDIPLDPEHMVMVEPGEKHYMKEATSVPFTFIVFCTTKDKDDKVRLG